MFFFFKQKTAYEMRISDWSSDVCSSDLNKNLHLIVDNYATHKHPKVRAWLDKHPRFHMHFTPTSTSWLNMVERFFRDITDKGIRRGAFASVAELEIGRAHVELQSLMRISYAVFCLTKKNTTIKSPLHFSTKSTHPHSNHYDKH